jgi:hypothetical protein
MVGGLFRSLTRGWVLGSLTIVICAYFAAKTAASLIEADVLVPSANAAPAEAPRPRQAVATKPKLDPNIISNRNIFCSTCEPEIPTGSSAAYRGEPAILIATSVADSGARATIRVLSTEVQGSWGLEETIPGVGTLTRIGGTSIDVTDTSNNTKTISLLDQPGGVAAGPDAATSGPPRKGPANPFEDRIKKLSDGSYEVDRGVVRELVAGAGRGAGASAMPIVVKGEVKGIRLRGVRPTSAAGAIGLRSGDTLSAIDGEPIKTMEQMLDLYGKLDKLGGIELQGLRAGKPLTVSLRFK